MSHDNSSDEESDFKAVNSANQQRLQDKVEKINYADGIADGRERVFQSSFDQGYADGLRTGIELAKMQQFYKTLDATKVEDNLAKEPISYQQLNLAKPTDKSHFKYLDHQKEALSVVSEKQKIYVDDLLAKFADTLPLTTNLFKSQGIN